jgi:triosephosphate isomerase
MNGLRASADVLAEVAAGYGPGLKARADLLVCPPATLVSAFAATAAAAGVSVGGQDCHAKASGAHSDAAVRGKAEAAHRAGLIPIVCVGETQAQREAGETLSVVGSQVRGSVPHGSAAASLVIAYEPVWAIGTGLTPTTADVAEVHALIRKELGALIGESEGRGVRILYGGSVKPSNARELMAVPNVDGALVGGASLVAADFLGIARVYGD